MNERIKELTTQAGGEFWQRIDSDGILWKEAYVTFDPPQSLEKFAELIVRECANAIINDGRLNDVRSAANGCVRTIREHFGVEE